MPVEMNWKAEAQRLEGRNDVLHELLESRAAEIEVLKEEVAEREKLYDNLSLNTDAIAIELTKVMESRRPLVDALAILHDAVSDHMRARFPDGGSVTKTAIGTVWHGDPVDNNLYAAQQKALEILKQVEGLAWQTKK